MKGKFLACSLLAIGLFALALPARAGDARLVGVWELSRFDNLHPQDSPGADQMPNILYVFYNDHELVFFRPGEPEKIQDTRGNLPFKDRVPYELNGTSFSGFLGLTNDLSGSAVASFPSKDEMDIRYPDGSIAVLTRISGNPASYPTPKLHCVPQTIRGRDYDAERLATMRSEMRTATRNLGLEARITGRWHADSEELEGNAVWFEFGRDGTMRTALVYPPSNYRDPSVGENTFVVKGSYLVSDRWCFAPQRISFEGEDLRIAFRPESVLELKRTDAAFPAPNPANNREVAPKIVYQACLADGSAPESMSTSVVNPMGYSGGGEVRSGTTTRGQAVYEGYAESPGETRLLSLGVGGTYWSIEVSRLPEPTREWTAWMGPPIHTSKDPSRSYPDYQHLEVAKPAKSPLKVRFRAIPFKEYLDGVGRRREHGPDKDIPGC